MPDAKHGPLRGDEDALLDGFLKLDTPEGYRAELIEGEIVVSPPPFGKHEKIVARINYQISRESKVAMDSLGHKGLELTRGRHCTSNFVIPDGVHAPREFDLFDEAGSWMPADDIAMVVEVTSTKPERDRTVKRRCYAGAGIPLYLLVDRTARSVTLFSEPDREAEDYGEDVRVGFGRAIDLPDPFGFALETAEFA